MTFIQKFCFSKLITLNRELPFLVFNFITVGAYFRFPSTSVKHLTAYDVADHNLPNSHLNLEDFL